MQRTRLGIVITDMVCYTHPSVAAAFVNISSQPAVAGRWFSLPNKGET